MQKVFSEYFRLNWYDFSKGMIVSVITAIITALYKISEEGRFPNGSDLETVAKVALAALLSYLVKNLFTDSTGTVASTERQKRKIS
jgi:hypothetical protein